MSRTTDSIGGTMAVKDYIDTNDFTKEELLDMIELAQSMKL